VSSTRELAIHVSGTSSLSGETATPPSVVRRILFLAPQPFFQNRGTPIAELAVLNVLAARGYHVDVLTYHEGEDVEIPNCTIHRIPALPGVKRIRPGFSRHKLLCDSAMLLKCMELVRTNRYDLIHAVEEAAFIAVAVRTLFGIPFVYDMDSSLAQQMVEAYPALSWMRRVLERSERLAIRRSLAVLAVCKSLEETALGHDPDKLVGRVEDASLLDDGGGGTERLSETIGSSGPIVLYIGNLEPYQGIDLLIDGFARALGNVPEARLVVIGGTEAHMRHYAARTDQLTLGHAVHFLGPRPLSQLGWYLEQATVLASPRIKGQNTPMKLYSYLDSGRAVVATRLPTHTQVLDDDIACLTAPEADAFGAALSRILQDEVLRDKLARRAKERVLQEFTPAAFQRKINKFYDAVEQKLVDATRSPTKVSDGGPPPETTPAGSIGK
jgi:glycosyltransferase involved in cell wall biosynthesis